MFHTDRPIYLQIRDMIVARILEAGDGAILPSVRALAAEAAVNPLTVAKAYQDLQAAGLVTARKGVGLFAGDAAADRLRLAERTALLEEERAHAERAPLEEHADDDLALGDEEAFAPDEIALPHREVGREPRIGRGGQALEDHAVTTGFVGCVSRRTTSPCSGSSRSISSRGGRSKSAKSKPGATVHPQSDQRVPRGTAACHIPAGTTCCGRSPFARSRPSVRT